MDHAGKPIDFRVPYVQLCSDQAMGFEIVTEPWNLARHQKEGTADHIVQYAGVQAAFFFHLFNTFTRTDQLNQQLHDNISQHDGLHYNIPL